MNIFSVGFSCGNDYDGNKLERRVERIDEISCRTETRQQGGTSTGMDQAQHDDDDVDDDEEEDEEEVAEEVVDFEIWPVEHPSEPPEEDRPVKCPMPAHDSPSVIYEGGKREKRFGDSMMRKRPEAKNIDGGMEEEEKEVMTSEQPPVPVPVPVRAVRKRHHTLTHGGSDNDGNNQNIMPLSRMPPLPPLPTHSITIFHMLQQIDEFDS